MTLYGIGALLSGLIIALWGSPNRSELPAQPHPEDLWYDIPGWMIAGIGLLLILYRISRSFRTYKNSM